MNPIFNLFGRSPMRPLQQHIDKAHACVAALLPFFEAILRQDWDTAERIKNDIADLEKQADHLKKDLRLHLPQSLFLPVARGDILSLLVAQEQLANQAEDIAGMIIGRHMSLPEHIAKLFMPFLRRCIDASGQARKAINELDELLASGFRGNEARVVEEMIVQLDKIEHDTDDMQIAVRQALFQMEDQLSPIDVIFLYKVIHWTGELADAAQAVGGRLLLLLAH